MPLLEGDTLGQFQVNQIEGEWTISSKKPLDREDTEKYLLKVMASDGKFQATTEVEIFVLDINDNSPECGQVRHLFWYVWGHEGSGWEGENTRARKKRQKEHMLRGFGLSLFFSHDPVALIILGKFN